MPQRPATSHPERPKAVYTHGQQESVLRSYHWRSVENSAAYLAPQLRPGMSLLDVGCGPATITAELADRIAPGTLTAVDSSQVAVDRARALLAGKSTVVVVGDVHDLDFPDDSFDIVHAHQVLQHVTDPVGALREMRRVCRPGGVVAARDADYEAMTWYPEEPGIADWLDLYRRVARLNGGEPDAGRRLLSWALAAGFTDVACSTSTWTYATPAEREWWAGVWADRLATSDFGAQVVREGHVSEAGRDRMIEAWRNWAAQEDGWFAILHGEIIARA